MKVATWLIALFLCVTSVYAQENTALVEKLAKATGEDERIDAYKAVFKYYEFSQPDSARYYLEAAAKEFAAQKSKKGTASMLVLSAFLEADQGRLEMAREKHAKALAIFEGIGHKRGVATSQASLGILDVKTGNFAEAGKHFLAALKIFESINDIDGVVNTYQKLGSLNEAMNSLDKALEYYFAGIKYIEQQPVKGTKLVWIYNNIGVVYGKKGNFEEARKYFEMALAGSEGPGTIDVRLLTLNNLGLVYENLGQYDKALPYLDEAIKLAQDKNLPENFARLSVTRASIVSHTNPAAALPTLLAALDTVKRLGLRNLEADIYDNLGDTYYRLGKYKESVEAVSKLRRLEDSLMNVEKSHELMNMQAAYELEKSQTKLAQAEEQGRSSRLVRNIILSVAGALALMLVLLTIVFRKSRQLNITLKKREEELSRLNATKDRLFSIIGHDLKGPMAHIPPVLQLLNDPTISEEERTYMIETLEAHSRASIETLDKLLFWGKNQVTGARVNLSDFSVGEFLRNNTELAKAAADAKNIKVENNIPNDIRVRADASHFDFIIRNLLSNAVKFTNSGGQVKMMCDTGKETGFVTFAISDTGIGISDEKLKSLFQPFAGSSRGTADEKGTGIGLMLCKEFVEDNGGKIWAETRQGAGTTFYFTMPKASA
ncbi:MAG: tetratricopeptide repeat-containing sensor histidine kinase [Taibaiella sp.]|nr:tetratricopeptide repeat-containing sensor histidine kinase [Taibaiella sp.]